MMSTMGEKTTLSSGVKILLSSLLDATPGGVVKYFTLNKCDQEVE